MDIKSLSEILGHANVQVTLQMYVHPFMDSKRSALEAASVLSGILVGTE
jgi:heme/copper-type cytochrome/quinol oxidase subunit 4